METIGIIGIVGVIWELSKDCIYRDYIGIIGLQV